MNPTEEHSLHIRVTLRQWKMAHVPVVWKQESKMKGCLGFFSPDTNTITLSLRLLGSWGLFDLVFRHELVHAIDYKNRGTFRRENGRHDFHGKSFRALCKQMKIPAWRLIPVEQYLLD